MVRSILVALDESPRAGSVFRAATSLARQLQAEIFIVRVIWIPPDIPPAAHVRSSVVEGLVEQSVRDELQALMRTAPGVTFGPPIVVEGEPWRQILRIGDELGADLIG